MLRAWGPLLSACPPAHRASHPHPGTDPGPGPPCPPVQGPRGWMSRDPPLLSWVCPLVTTGPTRPWDPRLQLFSLWAVKQNMSAPLCTWAHVPASPGPCQWPLAICTGFLCCNYHEFSIFQFWRSVVHNRSRGAKIKVWAGQAPPGVSWGALSLCLSHPQSVVRDPSRQPWGHPDTPG